jgi:hypothetical protein
MYIDLYHHPRLVAVEGIVGGGSGLGGNTIEIERNREGWN